MEKTHLGGYGELHLNKLNDQNGNADTDQVDFHRFVLFVDHEFNDRIRLVSELELEHSVSGEGKAGEIELEQAYVEMDLGAEQRHKVKAGLFLVPLGIMNETHEPPTFYGAERNNVEAEIIPTTWWEAGVGLSGQFTDHLGYDLAYTSGLAVDPAKFDIRGGRQKVAKAVANDGAATARLRWRRPGLELGTALNYQSDLTQGMGTESAAAFLWETHAVIQQGPFALRALYARWDIDSSQAEALGADEQYGWYLEPSWKFHEKWGVFGRFSEWDEKAGAGGDSRYRQWDVGLNFWPTENVVLKLDYQNQDSPTGAKESDGFNLNFEP